MASELKGSLLTKKHDPHDHVGHEGAGPEDHVQRHRDVEVERVVICHAHCNKKAKFSY